MTCPGHFLPQVTGKIFIHVICFQGNVTAIIKPRSIERIYSWQPLGWALPTRVTFHSIFSCQGL